MESKQIELKTKERNSSVELLRILAMFAIVLSHSFSHSGYPEEFSSIVINTFMVDALKLGSVGVNIFMLITGYFMSVQKIKYSNLMKLFSQVWTISIFCFVIGVIFNYPYTPSSLIKVFLPTIFSEYWFFTAYVIVYIFSPYINILIEYISKKKFLMLIGVLLVVWSFIPTISFKRTYGNGLVDVFVYYMFGAYIRKYPDNKLSCKKFRIVGFATSAAVLVVVETVLFIASIKIPALIGTWSYLLRSYNIFSVPFSIFVFAIFVYTKPFNNKVVNIIASCTFGVYLIHDNPVIRELLWKDWLSISNFYNSIFMVVVNLSISLGIFVICVIIEFIRQKTIAKPLEKIATKIYKSVGKRILEKFKHQIVTS